MNYIDSLAVEIAALCNDDSPTKKDMRLYRMYALLALTTGLHTTLENIHDAWSAWQTDINPEHRSLIPFDQLTREVQEMDRLYADAIRMVAVNRSIGKENYSFIPA